MKTRKADKPLVEEFGYPRLVQNSFGDVFMLLRQSVTMNFHVGVVVHVSGTSTYKIGDLPTNLGSGLALYQGSIILSN